MEILVTGATGMVGSELVPALRKAGHGVRVLSRSERPERDGIRTFVWDPAAGTVDAEAFAGVDAVVHLAGENVAGGRWSRARKERIRRSRVDGTTLVAKTLAAPDGPRPAVLVSASAIGIYGDRGDEVLTEDSAPGDGFLAEVATSWEECARPAADAGIRVVHPRIGIVLDRSGGALGAMLTPFRLGLGGVVGPGTQWMSWISRPDLVRLLVRCIEDTTLQGPVNAVAPNPVTNRDFTKVLGRVLGRPTILPLPSFAARLVLGEMADALLLASTRVEPAKLAGTDFRFDHADLEAALRATLESV